MNPRAVFVAVLVAVAGLLSGGAVAAAVAVVVGGPVWWLGRRARPRRAARKRRRWTAEEREFILSRDGYECVDCGSRTDLQIDHVIPFSRGGACSVDNASVRCSPCNLAKGAGF